MTLRDRVRRIRLYYRSGELFRESLANPSLAWRLPMLPGAGKVDIRFRSGRHFSMAARHWPLLPTACRLDRIGAEFEFLDDAKRIRVDGLVLYSPLWERAEPSYYKEVLLDDAYGVKGRDLSAATVVDVGAFVGDSVLAFARQGATVHAFEPSEAYCGFIRRNLEANQLGAKVILHPVGLSEQAGDPASSGDQLHFVEGVDYTVRKLPRAVDLLKLDCEGAEYHLLSRPEFLAHLSPLEIRMEYHRGEGPIVDYLDRAGYQVTLLPPTGRPVGLLTARRARNPIQTGAGTP